MICSFSQEFRDLINELMIFGHTPPGGVTSDISCELEIPKLY